MKELILVGNKPFSENLSNIIDNYDFVIRVNKMNNFYNSGTKLDGYYININHDFDKIHNGGEYADQIKRAGIVFTIPQFRNKKDALLKYITPEAYETIEVVDQIAALKAIESRNITSTITMLHHLLTTPKWYENYNITITGVDVEGRGDLFANGEEWMHVLTRETGYKEQAYLENLIKTNQIKFLECQPQL